MQEKWKSYEQVALYLLNKIAEEFGVDFVEGKQNVLGKHTGTKWEIDAKGVRTDDGGFMIVEIKRWTTKKIPQETIGGLAFRIIDTEASGGIVVSPLGLQEGATMIASSQNIFTCQLDENCTPHQFVIEFLGRFRIGSSVVLFINGTGEKNLTS